MPPRLKADNPNLKPVPAVWPASRPIKIVLVGEAPGETEALEGRPFVGPAGRVLDKLLETAGINRAECLVTNVFTTRPPENNVGWFFAKAKAKDAEVETGYPSFSKHGFLRKEWAGELARLKAELEEAKPNIVVALGATALWALAGEDKISKYRGTVIASTLVPGLKVLPTFHPAYIMRQWDSRPLVGADLLKVQREAEYPDIRRLTREIWIEPSWGDIVEFDRKYLQNNEVLTYDIETDPWNIMQILCIGLAPNPEVAIVIPFVDHRKPGWSYWENADTEKKVWRWLRGKLADPRPKKLAQNGMYDIQWLAHYGLQVRGETEDTMLLHHSLQPELPKGLDVLGSMYTNEAPWKQMVSFKQKTNKAEV